MSGNVSTHFDPKATWFVVPFFLGVPTPFITCGLHSAADCFYVFTAKSCQSRAFMNHEKVLKITSFKNDSLRLFLFIILLLTPWGIYAAQFQDMFIFCCCFQVGQKRKKLFIVDKGNIDIVSSFVTLKKK